MAFLDDRRELELIIWSSCRLDPVEGVCARVLELAGTGVVTF